MLATTECARRENESGSPRRKKWHRYDYFAEKRDALDKWAERLTVLVGDAPRVVSLKAGY